MRKKSHISLAKFLVENVAADDLFKHKKAFILGNILPDCKPSFLTTKHEFDGTYEMVQECMEDLTVNCNAFQVNNRIYMRNLGQVIHYIADYFTFPHNVTYDGSLKDHCVYENELKFKLKEYVKEPEVKKHIAETIRFGNLQEIFSFIEMSHKEYLKAKRSVIEDCEFIISTCYQVVVGILGLLELQKAEVLCYA